MNYELFIAKRIVFGPKNDSTVSRPIVKIAILGVSLGIAVMIIAVAIVTGFQKEIREKVIGFGGHIQIGKYDANSSAELSPINKNQAFIPQLKAIDGVGHVQSFATKAGIIKTNDAIEGVVLKGLSNDFDWNFFQKNIIKGKAFSVNDTSKSNEVLISKYIADRMKLKVNDKLHMYFIQQPPRVRAFKIAGIYETGLEEFDKIFVLCDIGHIQKLNDWNDDQIGGFEVLINDFDRIDELGEKINDVIGYELKAKTIKENFPQIFDWLELQGINVVIIIVLMIVVAGINMISALLIIILERTNMIGIMKAIGANNWSIRKVFLYIAGYLTGVGLLMGNIFGLTLCFLQKYFHLIRLPQESYYVPVVPINFTFSYFAILNVGTLGVCIVMFILPTYIITRITPIKAIRFN